MTFALCGSGDFGLRCGTFRDDRVSGAAKLLCHLFAQGKKKFDLTRLRATASKLLIFHVFRLFAAGIRLRIWLKNSIVGMGVYH